MMIINKRLLYFIFQGIPISFFRFCKPLFFQTLHDSLIFQIHRMPSFPNCSHKCITEKCSVCAQIHSPSNFRSYRDETTFDFQAAALSEFKDSLIKTEKGSDILPVGVIYGPNGGGKSNLLAALGCVISLVTEPVYELDKNHTRFIVQQKVSCVPYLFDENSKESPSRFELFFRIGDYEYRYYIALLHDIIEEETLYRRKLGASRAAAQGDGKR